jgi:hypothetical protein
MGRSAISFGLVLMAGYALVQTGQGAPTAAEPAAALDAIRQYALSYTKNLPNYTCTQTTHQIVLRGLLPPPPMELIEEQLSFSDNKEIRKVTKINGIPASPDGPDQLRGTPLRGEFGYLLDIIFKPETGANIKFERLAKLDGRRVYVFAFRVPQSSGYVLRESKRTIQVPFQGSVYADYETRAVVRIDMKCTDIPRDSEYMNAALTLDYKPANVAGREFVLPSHYQLHFQMVRGLEMSSADYTDYRRFSADATVQFEGVKQ